VAQALMSLDGYVAEAHDGLGGGRPSFLGLAVEEDVPRGEAGKR
jgi:hypothetical protein